MVLALSVSARPIPTQIDDIDVQHTGNRCELVDLGRHVAVQVVAEVIDGKLGTILLRIEVALLNELELRHVLTQHVKPDTLLDRIVAANAGIVHAGEFVIIGMLHLVIMEIFWHRGLVKRAHGITSI